MKNFWHKLPKPFFVLAPMEAVTDVVFRHVVKKAGAPDVFFTEFANATGWVHAGDQAIKGRLVKTEDEHPMVAQIWGGEPGDMETFARHCAELGFDGIDINMGCPAKSAVKSGGSALIRQPDVAIASIAAAKTAGLPVSVKTRLGYSHIDEWREWIATLLQQDISALTIHLRTKKEMSKVPAHYELIPDIKKLRDDIAPETLLIINGDVRDRAHGLELVEKYGVDGVMIGRGIFANPFCFREAVHSSQFTVHNKFTMNSLQTKNDQPRNCKLKIENSLKIENCKLKTELIDLLNYHLDLFDQYQPELGRPFETLKRFFKVYIRDFDGASDLRTALMLTSSTSEVRAIIANHDDDLASLD